MKVHLRSDKLSGKKQPIATLFVNEKFDGNTCDQKREKKKIATVKWEPKKKKITVKGRK